MQMQQHSMACSTSASTMPPPKVLDEAASMMKAPGITGSVCHLHYPTRRRTRRRCGHVRPSLLPGCCSTSWPCGSGGPPPWPGPCDCTIIIKSVAESAKQHSFVSHIMHCCVAMSQQAAEAVCCPPHQHLIMAAAHSQAVQKNVQKQAFSSNRLGKI
jgi:hypothetical protein